MQHRHILTVEFPRWRLAVCFCLARIVAPIAYVAGYRGDFDGLSRAMACFVVRGMKVK